MARRRVEFVLTELPTHTEPSFSRLVSGSRGWRLSALFSPGTIPRVACLQPFDECTQVVGEPFLGAKNRERTQVASHYFVSELLSHKCCQLFRITPALLHLLPANLIHAPSRTGRTTKGSSPVITQLPLLLTHCNLPLGGGQVGTPAPLRQVPLSKADVSQANAHVTDCATPVQRCSAPICASAA
ncbi:hypothetical protein MPL3365_230013 [Mesorhizobium plurifarium]|uniref:Uncharacterized protein n=1 Tax=Mesorhizobium plurifarium TaxID=69974 RepID=A0A090GAQ7_MESPL|nr:hypothetical protein MPL3365_230013 [Mesorhizobium plurifarium]